MKSINEVIETGIVFRPASKPKEDDGKVKTKAKKRNTSLAHTVLARPNRRPNTARDEPTDTKSRPSSPHPTGHRPLKHKAERQRFRHFSHPYPPIAL